MISEDNTENKQYPPIKIKTSKKEHNNNTTPRPPITPPTAYLALSRKINFGYFARFFKPDWRKPERLR